MDISYCDVTAADIFLVLWKKKRADKIRWWMIIITKNDNFGGFCYIGVMLIVAVVCGWPDRVAVGRVAAERLWSRLGYFSLYCNKHL